LAEALRHHEEKRPVWSRSKQTHIRQNTIRKGSPHGTPIRREHSRVARPHAHDRGPQRAAEAFALSLVRRPGDMRRRSRASVEQRSTPAWRSGQPTSITATAMYKAGAFRRRLALLQHSRSAPLLNNVLAIWQSGGNASNENRASSRGNRRTDSAVWLWNGLWRRSLTTWLERFP